MSNSTTNALATYVERARKVLQHEQRTHHQDQAIKPGGLDLFVVRWADEASAACKKAGLDSGPIHRFTEHLEGYRQQDPMQRAASLRAALAILNELDSNANGQNRNPVVSPPQSTIGGDKSSSPALPSTAPPPGRERIETRSASSAQGPHDERVKHGSPALSPVPPPGRDKSGPYDKGKGSAAAPQNTVHVEAGMTVGHTVLTLLSADVTAVPGVGASVAAKLHNLGIRTVRDLLFYFPREHRDYSKLVKIANIPFNEVTTTMGLIWETKNVPTSGGRTRTIATISDETGKLNVTWFNQPYLLKQLKAAQGSYLVVTGAKQRFGNKVEFSVRSHELPEQGDLLNTGRLVPIYPLTEGLHAKTLRRFTKWVVDHYADMVPEHLPQSIRSAGTLLPLPAAISQFHYPESEEMRVAAHRRLAFDELFLVQLGMQERRSRWQHEAPQGNAFNINTARIFIDPPTLETKASDQTTQEPTEETADSMGGTLWPVVATEKPFEATLPFSFTAAQKRVICEIFGDLALSKPMSRLLQGDVGAGKTAVAAAALLLAALNGYQGAIMAPTELLAEQHAQSISTMLEPFGIRTVLLTGGLRTRERALGKIALETGQAMVAVGTHALIQEDVTFQKLGLVIVDEQHRFGVEQRDILRQKGYHPHMLVMSATP